MNEPMTADEARALLAQDQQARVETARQEYEEFITAWAQRNRVRLDVSILLRAGQVIPQVQIVAIE